jgi:sec-independent protein translocase protein TatC
MKDRIGEKKQYFLDHLEELRRRLLITFLAWFLGTFFVSLFLDRLLMLLLSPVGEVIFLRPAEAFVTKIKVAFLGGFFLALPVFLQQLWKFFSPALHGNTQKHLRVILPLSYCLFLLGTGFCYFIVMPPTFRFLLQLGGENIQATLSFEFYISFVSNFLLGFGLLFQMPILIFFLMKTGFADKAFFRSKRKHMILLILLFAAILTPGPDIFSQLLLALPTFLLYEASVIFSAWILKK